MMTPFYRLSGVLLVLKWIVIIGVLVKQSSCTCLQPEVPENGRVVFSTSSPYSIGTQAKYNCDDGFLHIGTETRTCEPDGTWTGNTPVCAVNIALYKPASQSSTSIDDQGVRLTAALAVDGVLDGSCSSTGADDSIYWTVDLLQLNRVHAVEVLFAAHLDSQSIVSFDKLSISTQQNRPNGERNICAEYSGHLDVSTLHTFVCEQAVPARYVTIESSRESLRLCEVFVLSTSTASTFQCGTQTGMELLGVHDGQCYAKSPVNRKLSWRESQNHCLQSSASLPMHMQLEQHLFLAAQLSHRSLSDTQYYWIGLMTSLTTQTPVWNWIDGLSLNVSAYSPWVEEATSSGVGSLDANINNGHYAVTLAQSFEWRWVPMAQNVWNGWICQSSPRSCASPAVPANGGVMISRQPFQVGTSAFYFCASGFRLVGASTRICERNGVWSNRMPTCHAVDCGRALAVPNGQALSLNRTNEYGALTQYSCTMGYTLSTQQTVRICQADGTWSGNEPSCSPVSCGQPPSIVNGSFTSNGTLYGHVAHYTCVRHYRMVGNNNLVCQTTGRWTPDPPACYDVGTIKELILSERGDSSIESAGPADSSGASWWLVVLVCVLVVIVGVMALLFYVYRVRKSPETFSLGTVYSSSPPTTNTSGIGSDSDYSNGSANVNPSNYGFLSPYEYKESHYTSGTAHPCHYGEQMGDQEATSVVLPPHLLKMHQLPDGNIHLTLPARGGAGGRRLSVLSNSYLAPATPERPPRNKTSDKKFERPKKFQTMVADKMKSNKKSNAQSGNRVQRRRSLNASDIVMVGLQQSTHPVIDHVTHTGEQQLDDDFDEYDLAGDDRPAERCLGPNESGPSIPSGSDTPFVYGQLAGADNGQVVGGSPQQHGNRFVPNQSSIDQNYQTQLDKTVLILHAIESANRSFYYNQQSDQSTNIYESRPNNRQLPNRTAPVPPENPYEELRELPAGVNNKNIKINNNGYSGATQRNSNNDNIDSDTNHKEGPYGTNRDRPKSILKM